MWKFVKFSFKIPKQRPPKADRVFVRCIGFRFLILIFSHKGYDNASNIESLINKFAYNMYTYYINNDNKIFIIIA